MVSMSLLKGENTSGQTINNASPCPPGKENIYLSDRLQSSKKTETKGSDWREIQKAATLLVDVRKTKKKKRWHLKT